jgi:hypothetical protein
VPCCAPIALAFWKRLPILSPPSSSSLSSCKTGDRTMSCKTAAQNACQLQDMHACAKEALTRSNNRPPLTSGAPLISWPLHSKEQLQVSTSLLIN